MCLTILWGWCLKVGVIDTHLTFTFNHDVSLNALSNSAKIASIGPIFTKKDQTNIENYRPASIWNCFSKIYE